MAEDRVPPAAAVFNPGPRTRLAIALAFFAYVLAIRAHDVSSTFLLLGEQMRDWTVAIGTWRELPLTGAPSTAGGRGFGPAYYWILWAGRHLVAPITGNLPHGGGLFVALLQSAADTWLLVALTRRVPYALGFAGALLAATGPFEIGISSVIWNPPVAAALVKMTIAMVLGLGASPSLWRVAGTAAVGWLAVQAHASSFFVVAPVLAALGLGPIWSGQWRRAVDATRVVAEVVLLLQVPYVVAQFRAPAADVAPTVVLNSLASGATVHAAGAYRQVTDYVAWLLLHADGSAAWGFAALGAAIVASWRWRREPGIIAITLGPLVATTALFATWTRPYDSYWFLTLAPAVAVTFALAVDALPWRRASAWIGLAAAAGVLLVQPSHVMTSAQFFKYPPYQPLLAGSRDAARRAPVLRDLRAAFDVHPTTDVTYLYRLLGGRIGPDGTFVAVIQPDGTVAYEPAP